jgi:hypothetical protein
MPPGSTPSYRGESGGKIRRAFAGSYTCARVHAILSLCSCYVRRLWKLACLPREIFNKYFRRPGADAIIQLTEKADAPGIEIVTRRNDVERGLWRRLPGD